MATMAIEKQAAEDLTKKVATMNGDQRWSRLVELSDHPGHLSEAETLEFAKLFFGPEAEIAE